MLDLDYVKEMGNRGYSSVSTSTQSTFDILINIEILSGCKHACTGCFINKHESDRSDSSSQILDVAKSLSQEINKHEFNLREFVVGPTDAFSSNNFNDVLDTEIVKNILYENENCHLAMPAKLTGTSVNQFIDFFDKIKDGHYRDDMIIEFFSPIDDIDTMIEDNDHFADIMIKKDLFRRYTTNPISWAFVLQSSGIAAKNISTKYNLLLNKVRNEYETIIEMAPAFSRAPKNKQYKNLKEWNEFLESSINQDNIQTSNLSMGTINFNSFNFMGFTIYPSENGPQTILNSFIHEQAFFTHHKPTNVTGLNMDQIIERRDELITKGMKQSQEIDDCKDCIYNISCAHRLVFEAMDAMEVHECLLPKRVLDMLNPRDDRSHLWNSEIKTNINTLVESL